MQKTGTVFLYLSYCFQELERLRMVTTRQLDFFEDNLIKTSDTTLKFLNSTIHEVSRILFSVVVINKKLRVAKLKRFASAESAAYGI